VRAIAAELGRSPATISRELRRNRDPDSGPYRPFTAQRLAVGRRARPGRGKLLQDPVLAQFVQDRLGKRWSPEQISHALRREFPDDQRGGCPAGRSSAGCGKLIISGWAPVGLWVPETQPAAVTCRFDSDNGRA